MHRPDSGLKPFLLGLDLALSWLLPKHDPSVLPDSFDADAESTRLSGFDANP